MTTRCWCGGETTETGLYCLASAYHDPLATGRPAEVKKLYIAGPMSNHPECNYPAFNRVAALLEHHGYEVVNPASFGDQGSHYVDLVREDLRAMLDCHGIALLDNWHESAGARIEALVAGHLMMPVKPYKEWL